MVHKRKITVGSFCCLGMKFYYNGNLEPGIKALLGQALKAANQLLALFKRISFDVKTKLRLFGISHPSVCLRSRGIYGYNHIDKIHIKFCKNLLAVHAQTPNFAVYGDLGRFLLSVIAKERLVKYWLKLLSNKNSLMFKIFQSQIEGFDAHVQPSRFRHKRYWAEGIKGLFDELAFSHFGLNQDLKIPRYELIRNRIRDHFTQNWYAFISNASKLAYYCQFKTKFKLEKYIESISNDKLR